MVEYTQEIPGIISVRLYDAPSCRAIIERASVDGDWADAKVSARAPGDARAFNPARRPEARRASVLAPPKESEITRDFDHRMEAVIRPLAEKVWRVGLSGHSETHFVRYSPGNYYRPHTDTGAHLNDRYFTVVCYLNEDFEGGETSFPRLGYSVRPRQGLALLFPSTYLHSADPVKSGEKYVLVSWLKGPPPIRWI